MTGDKVSQGMAHKMYNCSLSNPCEMASCPVCMLIARSQFSRDATRLFKTAKLVHVVNIIPADGWVQDCKLKSFDVEKFIRAIKQRIRRLKLRGLTLLGACEVAYMESDNCWSFHFHLLSAGVDRDVMGDRLRSIFRKTDAIAIPVKVQSLNDPREQISYIFKSILQQKNRFIKSSGKGGIKNVPFDNRANHEAILRYLGQYKPRDLTLLYGIRRKPDGTFRFIKNSER